jgi:hypothetical protein
MGFQSHESTATQRRGYNKHLEQHARNRANPSKQTPAMSIPTHP